MDDDKDHVSVLFELTVEQRCQDPWLSRVLKQARHGTLPQDVGFSSRFAHAARGLVAARNEQVPVWKVQFPSRRFLRSAVLGAPPKPRMCRVWGRVRRCILTDTRRLDSGLLAGSLRPRTQCRQICCGVAPCASRGPEATAPHALGRCAGRATLAAGRRSFGSRDAPAA